MPEREFTKILSERLRYYLNKYEITQKELANHLGVGTTSVYNWCNGIKTPRMDKVDAMCSLFNCKRSDLMEDVKEQCESVCKGVSIPVFGRVAAGIPIGAIEDIIDYEEIPGRMAQTGEYFGLQIKDSSMEPKISDGDIVIVKQQAYAESGEIVIAMVNDTDASCRRLKRYSNGIALISTNPSYDPMFFSAEEIKNDPVRIIGKVVELRAKL